jgi:hypothetical protein
VAGKFYNRLGFKCLGAVEFSKEEQHALGVVYLWPERTKDARGWLSARGVELPAPGYEIPCAPATSPPAPSPETPTHPRSLR